MFTSEINTYIHIKNSVINVSPVVLKKKRIKKKKGKTRYNMLKI